MFVQANNPTLAILRERVEQKFGRKLDVPFDFIEFREDMFSCQREQLSESTLQRIWRYVDGYERISGRTLDILARYAGYRNWSDFEIQTLAETQEESEIFDAEVIRSESLAIGQKIHICWLPNRDCIVEYRGNRRFEAVKTCNSKLRNGDSFICEQFRLNWPLFLFDLRQGDKVYSNYVIGRDHGLTFLEVL